MLGSPSIKEGVSLLRIEQVHILEPYWNMSRILQIIGRATRDSNNKTHAQFTNLIAQPDAEDGEVKLSVNNMLKAIHFFISSPL